VTTDAPRAGGRPRGGARPKLDQLVRAARANLRRRFARQPVAFVISGGGSQGSFEVGVLRFLYDELRIRPAILCGISVGALIAAKLAEGDEPATGRRAIDEVEEIWRGLRSNDDMWIAEPWLEKLHSQVSWASSLRVRAAEQGTAGSQARVVLRMLGEVVRHPPEADGTLEALRQAMRAQSLMFVGARPEARRGEDRSGAGRRSGIRLRIGAVSLESRIPAYVTETGALHSRSDRPPRWPPCRSPTPSSPRPRYRWCSRPCASARSTTSTAGRGRSSRRRGARAPRRAAHIRRGGVGRRRGAATDFSSKGLLEIARRVSADIGPDETRRKETDAAGWGRRVPSWPPSSTSTTP